MTSKSQKWIAVPLLVIIMTTGVSAQAPPPASSPIDDYLQRPEPAFAAKFLSNDTTPLGKVFSFEFTSQTWRGGDWKHQLRVYEPTRVEHPRLMLLFISGGRTGGEVKPSDHVQGFALANACGARVAVLPQVPNQPLMGDRFEDDLIGETFVNYLATQEPDWPLLFPMVKSAVKAMDALQAWGVENDKPIDGFVVTGESKRGWTTWLTGAVDPRVKAIAPMVIPTLNMKAQSAHQLESWGKYSEQIEDYTRRGLTEKFDDPVGKQLWKIVDPYTYLNRIKIPVLQINGTNDRYWTLDSMNLFWNAIEAPKAVVYLPNAGHSLEKNREWAINGVAGLLRLVAAGNVPPVFQSSTLFDAKAVTCGLTIDNPTPRPKSVQLWSARSASRDFRESEWTKQQTTEWKDEPLMSLVTPGPTDGYLALFADLTYEIDGREVHFSSPIAIFGPEGQILPKSQVEARQP